MMAPSSALQNPSGPEAKLAEELNIMQIWTIIRSRWVITILVPVLVSLLAFGATFSLPTEYKGSVLLAKSKALESLSGGGSAIGSNLGAALSFTSIASMFLESDTGVYIAELGSKNLLLEFVNKHDLKKSLFPDRWDDNERSWIAEKSRKPEKTGAPGNWETYEEMIDKIEITEDFEKGTILLELYWNDPEHAAKLANDLVALFNARVRERQLKESLSGIDYLQQSLKTIENMELRLATTRLMQRQLERYLVAQGVQDFVFSVIDPAIPPIEPSRPRRVVIATLLLIISVIIGWGVALYSYQRRPK